MYTSLELLEPKKNLDEFLLLEHSMLHAVVLFNCCCVAHRMLSFRGKDGASKWGLRCSRGGESQP